MCTQLYKLGVPWGNTGERGVFLVYCQQSAGSECRASRGAAAGLTGGVVADAVEHFRAGPGHHLSWLAPGPAGTDPIDGGLAERLRGVWGSKSWASHGCSVSISDAHLPGARYVT